MKKRLLKNIYKFDKENQVYLIDISLDSYQELFNGWDASPTWKKDLDPGLARYLESSSYDIPKNNNLQVNFFLSLELKELKKEKKARDGITNHIKNVIYFTKVNLRYDFRKIIVFIALGFFLITTAYLLQNQTSLYIGFDVLIEGIFIGGWVLLWEAFSLFFFSMHAIRKRKAMYIRFLNSKIQFNYK